MRFCYAKPTPGKKDGKAVAVYEMSGDDRERHLSALKQIAIGASGTIKPYAKYLEIQVWLPDTVVKLYRNKRTEDGDTEND